MYMYDHFLARKARMFTSYWFMNKHTKQLNWVLSWAWQAVSNFDLFNMDDIDAAFQNCVAMTYSQHLPLSGMYYLLIICLFSLDFYNYIFLILYCYARSYTWLYCTHR
jgi:hypothetical protein